ncbi:Histidinol-phosphatase [hydrothermal vent metagenome]|uniref:histidinol-phosphatase n=1 Tax=hydrothermal vent metagenome TaxID=652676 RepID=A0A3B1E7A7_9ZZZZ
MRIDLHNHTTLCNHATGTMENYVKKAIELGIDTFGFSCHAPMIFEPKYRMTLEQSKIYEKNVLFLKNKYKKDIEILLAYEVDFMFNSKYIEKSILNAKVDYLIGSVHFIDKWGFDNPEFIGKYKEKDIDQIWDDYFKTISKMVKTGYFHIVGHLDLIKIFKYLPKQDITSLALQTMRDIKKSGMVLEINSSGFRKPIKEQYPSYDLLKLAYYLDIPITFGSDAHAIEQIGYKSTEIKNLAKEIGFKQCTIFRDRIPEKIVL